MSVIVAPHEFYEGLRQLIPNLPPPEAGVVAINIRLRPDEIPTITVRLHARKQPSETPLTQTFEVRKIE